MKKKKILVVFPFSFRDRTHYIIDSFFSDTTNFSSVIHLSSRWTRIEDFRTRLYLCKKKAVIPPVSFSLKAFAAKIVQEQTQYRLISGIEQILILLKLCLSTAESLKIAPVSFATGLKSFIKDFKVSHENLDFTLWKDEIENFPWKYDANKELLIKSLEIMQKYQQFLKENLLVDEDDLYNIASRQLKNMKFDTVLLEGILEFIPSQKRFIENLAGKSQNFICVYQFDRDAPYDARKLILEPNFEFLKSITDDVIFIEDREIHPENCSVFNFPSPDEEIKGIGEMIIDEISKNDTLNWEDFLVVFPQMLSYRELVERIFRRMKIPFCMTPGYVLTQDPSIVAIISLLNWLDTPYWWESIMSIFTSPFFSFDFNEAVSFSAKTRKNFKGAGFFPDENWLKEWNNWNRISHVKKIMEINQDSLQGWVDRLIAVLKETGWNEFDSEGKKTFMELLSDLKSDIRTDRQSFVRILKSALELTEVEKSKGTGVKVMGILDSIGMETKFAFLGGATDDALPESATREEFFLPEGLKAKLNLSTYNLRLARERLDIYRLKKSHVRVVFSYPSKVSGRQKGKSIMLYGLEERSPEGFYYVSGSDEIFSLKPDIEKFRNKFIKNGILHFTVSHLDKIARCPYDFYLTYVEEIEPYRLPEIEEIPELWGTLLHSAVEKAASDFKGKVMDNYCIEQQCSKFREYVEQFLSNPSLVLRNIHYKIPPVVKSFLEKRKQSVFESFRNALMKHRGHKIVELEKQESVNIGSMVITGKFDRIEESDDGTLEIIDFKSGKPPQLNKKYPETGNCLDLKNLELPLYSLIQYKLSGRKNKVFVWSLNFDESAFEIEYPQIAGFLEIFEKSLENLAKKLINNDFDFTTKGKNCFGCIFANFCILKGEDSD